MTTPSDSEEGPGSFRLPSLAIFLAALAVRLIHVALVRDEAFSGLLLGDAEGYDRWARELAAGDWVGDEVFYQAPLYPYFLGLLYALFGGDLLVVRVVQALVGACSCLFLAQAGRRLFSPRAGLAAGLLLAVYPPAVFHDGLIQKSVLDGFFLGLSLWLLAIALERPRRGPLLGLGLALGCLSLTRENALVFVVVVLGWLALRARSGWREAAGLAAPFALGLVLTLAPVALRNGLVGGECHLTTSQLGPNFYMGNHAGANGRYVPLREGGGHVRYERQDAIDLAEEALGRELTPGEVSDHWLGLSLDWIAAEPGAWLALMGRKVLLVWNAVEDADTDDLYTYARASWPLRLFGTFLHFGVLAPLAAAGLCVAWERRARLGPLLWMVALYTLGVAAFHVYARFRYPLVPFLVLFAGTAIAGLPAWLRSRPRSSVAGCLVLMLAVGVASNWPLLDRHEMAAVTLVSTAQGLDERGRGDESVDYYRAALEEAPGWDVARYGLANALRARGELEEAIALYEGLLLQRPRAVEVMVHSGTALLEAGRATEAVARYRAAVALLPGDARVHHLLGLALESAGDLVQAQEEQREALRLDPDLDPARRRLRALQRARAGEPPR